MKTKQLAVQFLMAAAVAGGAATFGAAAQTAVEAEAFDRLVSPTELAELSAAGEVQIIDLRSEKRIVDGTIPGAVWMTYKDWRGPKSRPGRPMPEAELEDFLSTAGIKTDMPIVLVGQSGRAMPMGQAAFVYWLLKTAGFDDIALLQGGFTGWQDAGFDVAREPTELQASFVDVEYRYDWWADPAVIFGIATHQMDGAILDARFERQVERSVETGKPMMSLPLAQLIPVDLIAENITPERLTPEFQDVYRDNLRARDIDLGDDTLISICQTGELSALSWFYASEIVGIDNVLYYPDAIHGWKADGGLMFGLNPGDAYSDG